MRSLKYRKGIKNRSLTKYKKSKGRVLRGGLNNILQKLIGNIESSASSTTQKNAFENELLKYVIDMHNFNDLNNMSFLDLKKLNINYINKINDTDIDNNIKIKKEQCKNIIKNILDIKCKNKSVNNPFD